MVRVGNADYAITPFYPVDALTGIDARAGRQATMRRLLAALLVAALVPGLALASASRWPVSETQLDNGMTVIVREDHRAPVVVSQVWYAVGSSYEHRGITGVSHVLEHMMFKGTDAHGPGEFSRIISRNGGEENAFTSRDYTAYFERLAADRLDLALALEADRMANLALADEHFASEREVVIEERRQRVADNPASRMHERFNAVAHLGSPYAQPIIGWQPDLEAMTLDDLQAWYERYYSPNNATLVVAGDVEPEAVFDLARKHFGDMKARELPEAPGGTGMVEPGARRIDVADSRARVPRVVMGYDVPSAATADSLEDAYALMMASAVLDGGDGARLSQDLVRDQAVAARAGASYRAIARLGTQFTLQAAPQPGVSVDDLESALREQIERLRSEPVDDATLERARNQMLADHLFQMDSVFYQAMEIGQLETTGIGWEIIKDYESGLEAVTAADVQRVAQQYFTEQRLTVGRLQPESDKESAE